MDVYSPLVRVPRLPMNSDEIVFHDWKITTTRSHILESICTKDPNGCVKDSESCCELCTYRHSLTLPHLPDMVFHKNILSLVHSNGATITFVPIDALRLVDSGVQPLQVSCAQEWKESRSNKHMEEKFKPFDWTFSTEYQGNLNDKFRIEETDSKIDLFKLMEKETILFYQDITLFEDELHDNGIASCSVKIRVMPSGYFILLRFFLRVDNVLLKMHDTRYHYEIENNYVLKEYTARGSKVDELKHVPPAVFTMPQKVEKYLPVIKTNSYKLFFKD